MFTGGSIKGSGKAKKCICFEHNAGGGGLLKQIPTFLQYAKLDNKITVGLTF